MQSTAVNRSVQPFTFASMCNVGLGTPRRSSSHSPTCRRLHPSTKDTPQALTSYWGRGALGGIKDVGNTNEAATTRLTCDRQGLQLCVNLSQHYSSSSSSFCSCTCPYCSTSSIIIGLAEMPLPQPTFGGLQRLRLSAMHASVHGMRIVSSVHCSPAMLHVLGCCCCCCCSSLLHVAIMRGR